VVAVVTLVHRLVFWPEDWILLVWVASLEPLVEVMSL
jgi:hypothetical protein